MSPPAKGEELVIQAQDDREGSTTPTQEHPVPKPSQEDDTAAQVPPAGAKRADITKVCNVVMASHDMKVVTEDGGLLIPKVGQIIKTTAVCLSTEPNVTRNDVGHTVARLTEKIREKNTKPEQFNERFESSLRRGVRKSLRDWAI